MILGKQNCLEKNKMFNLNNVIIYKLKFKLNE